MKTDAAAEVKDELPPIRAGPPLSQPGNQRTLGGGEGQTLEDQRLSVVLLELDCPGEVPPFDRTGDREPEGGVDGGHVRSTARQ